MRCFKITKEMQTFQVWTSKCQNFCENICSSILNVLTTFFLHQTINKTQKYISMGCFFSLMQVLNVESEMLKLFGSLHLRDILSTTIKRKKKLQAVCHNKTLCPSLVGIITLPMISNTVLPLLPSSLISLIWPSGRNASKRKQIKKIVCSSSL